MLLILLKGKGTLNLSLDAEKAFDRVKWDFLFATLGKFNLGNILLPLPNLQFYYWAAQIKKYDQLV